MNFRRNTCDQHGPAALRFLYKTGATVHGAHQGSCKLTMSGWDGVRQPAAGMALEPEDAVPPGGGGGRLLEVCCRKEGTPRAARYPSSWNSVLRSSLSSAAASMPSLTPS